MTNRIVNKVCLTITLILFHSLTSTAQKVIIVEVNGATYACISNEDVVGGRGVIDRTKMSGFYTNLPLYTYSKSGTLTDSKPIMGDDGKQKTVKRITKHVAENSNSEIVKVNKYVSKKFIISPTEVYNDGGDKERDSEAETGVKNYKWMDWAMANGYLATANSVWVDIASSAVQTGCSNYRGAKGADEPGTWRVPTQREFMQMIIFADALESMQKDKTGFKPFNNTIPKINDTVQNNGYWTATHRNVNNTDSQASRGYFYRLAPRICATYQVEKTHEYMLRCIRDIN